jgi:SH3 domain protein
MMRSVWLLTLLMLVSPWLGAAYITDQIRVGLYATPDTTSRPTQVLLSGEEIKVLEQRGSFVRVQLKDGAKGWVGRQYVVNDEPSVRALLTSRQEVAGLKAQLDEQGKAMAEQKAKLDEQRKAVAEQKAKLDERVEEEARLKVELSQSREELLSLQKALSGRGPNDKLKEALAAANQKITDLEARLAQKKAPAVAGQAVSACEQQLEEIEQKELQCQVRLAKYDKDNKDSVVAENEQLREIMQQAVNLLGLPPDGSIPVMVPASLLNSTPAVSPPPVLAQQAAPTDTAVATAPAPEKEVREPGLPVWVYMLMVLTLITGVIGGFALFDYRSRYRYSVRL